MMTEPTIRDVLDAMQLFATSVDKRFDLVDQKFERVDERLDALEQEMRAVKREQREMRAEMATKSDIAQLVTKEYLEGRLAHIR